MHVKCDVEDEGICGSQCFAKTKYSCLTCANYFCKRCSVFEIEEDTWKVGKSVGYCGSCFKEMIERESSQCIMTKEKQTAKQKHQ